MAKSLECPSCGAPIAITDSRIAFCHYCGSPLLLTDDRSYKYHEVKDGNRTYHEIKDKSFRTIVDSDIEKVRADYALKMRELDLREEKLRKRENHSVGIAKWVCILILGMFALLVIASLVNNYIIRL